MDLLIEKNFLKQDRDGKWKMKDIRDVMDKNVENIPSNFIHMF